MTDPTHPSSFLPHAKSLFQFSIFAAGLFLAFLCLLPEKWGNCLECASPPKRKGDCLHLLPLGFQPPDHCNTLLAKICSTRNQPHALNRISSPPHFPYRISTCGCFHCRLALLMPAPFFFSNCHVMVTPYFFFFFCKRKSFFIKCAVLMWGNMGAMETPLEKFIRTYYSRHAADPPNPSFSLFQLC